MCIAVASNEAEAVLIVDADTVLTHAIMFQASSRFPGGIRKS
jgi:hypothetical protein